MELEDFVHKELQAWLIQNLVEVECIKSRQINSI